MDEITIQKKILAILESNEYTDWHYDGTDEVSVAAFDREGAALDIFNFLKENNLLKS